MPIGNMSVAANRKMYLMNKVNIANIPVDMLKNSENVAVLPIGVAVNRLSNPEIHKYVVRPVENAKIIWYSQYDIDTPTMAFMKFISHVFAIASLWGSNEKKRNMKPIVMKTKR
ncbi:MAG: hypothetical protein COV47_05135 [Candidatus Diapherotrites archaeon CG11_big_fil_rev_8_21_14_0_20_37_9]|nr:MAG: hypothetical protein COV47_05135 [Candidatus Diapherotrites archaeon CG11_big_fil_rev_8_21_14_0_20_37_9]